jgi:CNT family concentrative nucleoside transporter
MMEVQPSPRFRAFERWSDGRLRATLGFAAVSLTVAIYLAGGPIGPRVRAAAGALALVMLVGAFSANLRAINWRTVGWGMALQVLIAILILKLEVGGVRPGYAAFSALARAVGRFLEFSNAGAQLVFGGLADATVMSKLFPGGFVFAFTALPTIIFISSFFAVLYHLGILQFVVRQMARAMVALMQTSGPETLAVAAEVFVGQTEAPLIVKPYVPTMTQSELFTLLVGGLATIAGGVMAVYIGLGADPIAILTTSVMAAPCSLYLSKILYPETETPVTRGRAHVDPERRHVNVIDAAASGASEGLFLALNVAAMLIAFMSFIAFIDFVLGLASPGLSLAAVFARIFAPMALLMGIPAADVPEMADLLGTKLVTNEFVAFVKLTSEYRGVIDERSYTLATFALTGFANFGSVAIQLGGIGGLAPERRGDLARLSTRALFVGFVATVVNACVAGMLI